MPEFFFNGKRVTEDEMNRLIEASAGAIMREEAEVMREFNVTQYTAAGIVYLRGRSRWTQEKENELINRDHAGNPIPLNSVLSGDF